ncbi:hypothetical protein PRIPAC_83284 [Pristionchus pacificus]|uniref:Uncharacterized protein n=1 Tax=Pristionchus pacificus TaxID=54126 RepID=A0A2A6BMC0_PRIPA|nr:hypothetical protein PRIPAC_83284 [Pristionchus pacificus]|eukprot:PDM67102.1 hypothetical protein PRIPAC_48519 [Pristionchus pacificus]
MTDADESAMTDADESAMTDADESAMTDAEGTRRITVFCSRMCGVSLVYYLTVSAHIFESTKFFADELNLIWPDKSLRCIAICIGRSAAILLQSESREAKPSQLTILVVEIGGWSYLWRRERGRHCQREWKEADLRKGRKRDKETPFWWKGEAELTLHSLLSDLTLQPDMLFRAFLLLLHVVNGKRIIPETVRDLSIQLCSHEKNRNSHSFGLLHLSPATVNWCVTATTNKGPAQQIDDFARSTKSSSLITFSWAPLNSPLSCSIQFNVSKPIELCTFNGYRSIYRLTPDFGAYSSCQSHLSKHVHGLSHSLHGGGKHNRKRRRREEDEDCPIINFPQTYNEFSSCQLGPETWYRLDARSAIFSEEFVNGSYSTRWANSTSHFLYFTNFELERSGSADQWMSRILSIDARPQDCTWALAHLTVAKEWTDKQEITLVYRVHSGHTWISRNITHYSISDWEVFPVKLDYKYEEHQVCAHLKNDGSKRGRVCKIFSISKNCTANSSDNSTIFMSIFFSIISIIVFIQDRASEAKGRTPTPPSIYL